MKGVFKVGSKYSFLILVNITGYKGVQHHKLIQLLKTMVGYLIMIVN